MEFLVICRLKSGASKKNVIKLIRTEAKAAWKLYEAGLVREFHYISDLSGAVMRFEAANLDEVKRGVETLPMIKAGLLEPDYIPLKQYTGFGKLFAKSS